MAVLLGGGPVATLARVSFSGGAPREILENVSGADWGPDGESLAVVRTVAGRYRLEYPVGTVLYETEGRPPVSPRVSTDGELVAFFDFDAEVGDASVCVAGPNRPKQVLSRGWRGTGALNWSPKGDEIWFSANQSGGDPALFAVNLSGRQRVLSQVAGWIVMQDVARDGRVLLSAVNSRLGILYMPPDGSTERDLAWLDASLVYELSDDAKLLLFVELSDGEGRKPITPEGVRATRVSPDGHSFAIAEAHKLLLGDISGGSPRTISDLQSGETVVRWSGDGRYLFLRQLEGDTIRVSRLDVSTRRKEPWHVLKVPEPGAEFFGPLALSADGRAYACSFQRDLANLYLVKGLR